MLTWALFMASWVRSATGLDVFASFLDGDGELVPVSKGVVAGDPDQALVAGDARQGDAPTSTRRERAFGPGLLPSSRSFGSSSFGLRAGVQGEVAVDAEQVFGAMDGTQSAGGCAVLRRCALPTSCGSGFHLAEARASVSWSAVASSSTWKP